MSKDLTTAEGVTRYIRSQKIQLSELIETLDELIATGSKVLPNLNTFAFELLVDRLNDFKNKNFQLWKFDSEIWLLFVQIWTNLGAEDARIKRVSLKRLKTTELLTKILAESSDKQLFDRFLEAISLIVSESYVEISLEASTEILATYLKALSRLRDADDNTTTQWSKIIAQIYNSASSNNLKSSSKKYLNEFSSVVLPQLLKQGPELSFFDSMVDKVLFSEVAKIHLVSNIKTLVDATSEDDSLLISLMYHIVTQKVSESDVLQQTFVIITEKFPNLTTSLLEKLSGSKKTLSFDFLSSIFEQELLKSKSDLNLIYLIVDIESEIGFKYGQQILDILLKGETPKALKVSSVLIDSYVKAREFEMFYESWIKLIASQLELFSSLEFSSLITDRLNNLSSFQLDRLLKTQILPNLDNSSKDSYKYFTAILPIVEYATKCTDPLRLKVLRDNLLNLLSLDMNLKKGSSSGILYWRIILLLLTFYDTNDFQEDIQSSTFESLIQKAKAQLKFGNIYVFYALFKIRECYTYDLSKDVTKAFIKLFSKSEIEVQSFCFNRWFIIFSKFFKTEEISSLIKDLLTYDESKVESWNLILANGYIFEQKILVDQVIEQLLTFMRLKTSSPAYLDLIAQIPVWCFNRTSKALTLDLLTTIATSEKENLSLNALSVILKLLELPTYRSTIEKDFEVILMILESEETDARILTEKIFLTIWKHRTNQLHEETHRKWVEGVISRLETLNQENPKKLLPEHYATAVVLSQNSSDYESLGGHFESSLLQLLKVYSKHSNKSSYQLSWILNALYNLNISEQSKKSVRKVMKTLADSPNLNSELFNLLTKISGTELQDQLHLLVLYLVLGKEGELDEALTPYLTNLELKAFLNIFAYYIQGFPDADSGNVAYFGLWNVFVKALNFYKSGEEVQKLQHHLAVSLSAVLSAKVENDAVLRSILSTLRLILSSMSWALTQYSFELVLTIISEIASWSRHGSKDAEIYVLNSQVLSLALLHHRHRLSNRHHILMNCFTKFLECLFFRKSDQSIASGSVECGSAFQRLLSNLCEPGNNVAQSNSANQLTTVSSVWKKSMLPYLPTILINYVHFQIRFNMKSEVREEILSGIFLVFDALTQDELQIVNSSLDAPGKNYFKILYSDYNKFGKWHDDI